MCVNIAVLEEGSTYAVLLSSPVFMVVVVVEALGTRPRASQMLGKNFYLRATLQPILI